MRLIVPLLILCLTAAAHGGPATQPVETDVLVLSFDAVDADRSEDWIGAGVQQSLVTDLSQLRPLQVTAGGSATTEIDAAVRAARAAGARFVITGSYQAIETDLRISGQVIDASSGRVLGGLKATGNVRDLFALQDTLGTQAQALLGEQLQPAPEPAPPQAQAPAALPPPVVVNVNPPAAAPRDRFTDFYTGSTLQRAVRRGSVDDYRRTYDNVSYYGDSFYDHWGFPSAVRQGVWPGYLYVSHRHYRHPVIRSRPPHHHPSHPGIAPNDGTKWQPPRAAGVPLVP